LRSSNCFDIIVVDTNYSVRVSDRDIESKIVVKCVVVGEIELSKGCTGYIEFDSIRVYDKAEEESEDSYKDDKIAYFAC
jgi:hypothetical protein